MQIGAPPVWIPGCFEEVDGNEGFCIGKTRLSGYINEGDRAFYTTYDAEDGTMDIEPDLLCKTREAAEAKLTEIRYCKCRVCDYAWNHA